MPKNLFRYIRIFLCLFHPVFFFLLLLVFLNSDLRNTFIYFFPKTLHRGCDVLFFKRFSGCEMRLVRLGRNWLFIVSRYCRNSFEFFELNLNWVKIGIRDHSPFRCGPLGDAGLSSTDHIWLTYRNSVGPVTTEQTTSNAARRRVLSECVPLHLENKARATPSKI